MHEGPGRLPSRRRFMKGAGAACLTLLAGCGRLPWQAPPPAKVHRIAMLRGASPSDAAIELGSAFRQGMRDLGYIEGHNLLIEERYASGLDRIAEAAAELVRLQPDVIVTPSVPAVRAVLALTTTVPIVSTGTGTGALDMVASGLAVSHARPGGSVTGLTIPSSLVGKQLQLLQEAVPTLSRVAVLFDTSNPEFARQTYEVAARALGLVPQFVGANVREDLEPVFEAAVREQADGLVISGGPVSTGNQPRIAELALEAQLPSMWSQSEAAGRGGLMAYGPNRADQFRRAAYFVDRILKGAKPADLPIEEPMRFDFIINLNTAEALGLTLPQHVLLQATEVVR